ncbi:MAG: O-antigen ligase family protein [bacterium]|nr:O-antigen ligase family protein [bacterium]
MNSRIQTSSINIGVMVALLMIVPLIGVMMTRVSFTISLGIVLGVVVFILSFANVQFATYILIFATLLSPEFGSRTTSGSGLTVRLDDFLLLVIGFSQLTKAAMYQEVGLFSYTPLNRYISIYMIICVISTGVGVLFERVNPLTGFFFVLKYFEYFIVYFMIINNLENKKQAKGYLIAILITATIVCLVAIAQIPAGGRVAAPFEGESGEPNTLGGYLLLITSVVGGLLLYRGAVTKFSHRVLLYLLMLLMFIPILFTLSRATWLAAVPVFLAFWILSDKKIIMTGIVLVGFLVAPWLMPDAVTERISYTTEKQESKWARAQQESLGGMTFDTSSSARIRSWLNALEAIPAHPFLGWGVTGWRFIDAQYFKIAVETGLIGLAAFLMFLWKLIRLTWDGYKNTKDPLFRGVSLGFLVGVIAMIFHATMTNTFIIVRIMEPFCILAGIVIGVPALEREEEAETDQTPSSQRPSIRRVGPLYGNSRFSRDV